MALYLRHFPQTENSSMQIIFREGLKLTRPVRELTRPVRDF